MNKICLECGHIGHPKRLKRGSMGMEIMIWSVLLIPGPFYSIWRRTGPERGCASCKSQDLIPETSLAGKAWKEKHMLHEEVEELPVASIPESEMDPRNYRF
jgi:hypothetical protein